MRGEEQENAFLVLQTMMAVGLALPYPVLSKECSIMSLGIYFNLSLSLLPFASL